MDLNLVQGPLPNLGEGPVVIENDKDYKLDGL